MRTYVVLDCGRSASRGQNASATLADEHIRDIGFRLLPEQCLTRYQHYDVHCEVRCDTAGCKYADLRYDTGIVILSTGSKN